MTDVSVSFEAAEADVAGKRARSRGRGERRRELLAHALAVFGEKGYHAATVEDVVSRAGVAHGTFYLYFPDKRAAFAELLGGFLARLREAIVRLDPAAPIEGQVAKNVARLLDLLAAERGFARILLAHAAGVDRELDRRLRGFYDALAAALERALVLGRRARLLRPHDARLAAYALLGMVKEVAYRMIIAGFAIDRKRAARELAAQSLAGLLAAPREAPPAAVKTRPRGTAARRRTAHRPPRAR
jgi:AcrR family transcriptional regulator